MRILPFVLLASAVFAEPWLPRVAQAFNKSPSAKISLDWSVVSAGGFVPPRTTKGTLKIAEGNRFRFDSDALVAVGDGTTIWQWNGSTNQVLVQSAAKMDPSALPAGILKAALEGAETAAVPEKFAGKNAQKLSLDNSRPPLSKYARAWLWIDPSELKPLRIEVEDQTGSRTSWTLLKISRWKPGAKDFVYEVPKGADVVDMRK